MLRIDKVRGWHDMWGSGAGKTASDFVASYESEVPTLSYIVSGRTTFALRAS